MNALIKLNLDNNFKACIDYFRTRVLNISILTVTKTKLLNF